MAAKAHKGISGKAASVFLIETLLAQLRIEARQAEEMLDEALNMPDAEYYTKACAVKCHIKAEQLKLAERMANLGASWYARSLHDRDTFERRIDDIRQRGKVPNHG